MTLVQRLAAARIGTTFNQYRDERLAERLARYLDGRTDASILLVGEAAGYRGARVSGIPFTSERQLTGDGPGEATATIVHRVLAELALEDDVVLWNVVPTHPGTATSNRRADACGGHRRAAVRTGARARTSRPRGRPDRRGGARRAVRPPSVARRRGRLP